MSAPRDVLIDLLQTQLGSSATVLPFASQLDVPEKATVMPRLDDVRPGAALGQRAYTFALILLSRHSSVGVADVELEDLLELVCVALGKAATAGAALTWERAKRGTYNQTVPAIEVTVTVHLAVS